MPQFHCFDIDWDTDDDFGDDTGDNTLPELPRETILEIDPEEVADGIEAATTLTLDGVSINEQVLEAELSALLCDRLSDKFGFCLNSFDYKQLD